MAKCVRDLIVQPGTTQQMIEQEAHVLVAKWLEGKDIKKIIFVKDKLINFVV